MSRRWRGLTWDHPRGYAALRAAADQSELIEWHTHSLEGFESAPIGQLCEQYDLIVLDHPHLGEALAQNCLQPLDTLFTREALQRIERDSMGLSYASYRMAGCQWGLPLDAATQVMAARADLLARADAAVPTQWHDVLAMSRRTGQVAMSLAGPHAFLTLLSICAALDPQLALADGARWHSPDVVREACELLVELASLSPACVRDENPIGLLQYMTTHDDVMLCPLVYGYVNYTQVQNGVPLAFHDAPRFDARPPGSILGGTGIAVTKRCEVDTQLIEHLLWLLSETAQSGFIPQHAGQPSHIASWRDANVNAASGNFYLNTFATVQAASLRPRHDGFIAIQAKASALLRDGLLAGASAASLADRLNGLCRPRAS
ncbi:extracellular solute-binding protein [Paraburkholderia sp. ZP32-5]|uniref:extracellular solute-binding protein n=1 Tax=Paraburkholderia sp. ZP32-5 TaxID=2883245 RepID=UPI001F1A9F30|nr:extracellular solute-binding protein [Paraburkholderia sp. ZP32-5]